MKKKIVYLPPTYELIQNEGTRFNDDGQAVAVSYHNKAAFVARLERGDISVDDTTANLLAASMPKDSSCDNIDTSHISDDDLLESAPNRYCQTSSEQQAELRERTSKMQEDKANAEKVAKEKAEQERLDNEGKEFTKKLQDLFSE